MSGKVFCFGELLLRMSPALDRDWISRNTMSVYVGGAELNVANALATWKMPVKYCTALPDNYLSDEITADLNEKNIDTSAIIRTGARIGTYYLPAGADLKHAGVIYDRANSSFAGLRPGTINWDQLLEGCSWFHFSAISPALNEDAAVICKEALMAAAAKGITISVDLNYRARLWQYGKDPVAIMPELVSYCNVIMGNLWAVESLLGIAPVIAGSEGRTKQQLAAVAHESMQELKKHYPRATSFAYTFRLQNEYFACLDSDGMSAVSATFPIVNVVDRVGSGDCFMAGLIYGLYHGHAAAAIVQFAAAAAAGKLYEPGDATKQTIEDIYKKIPDGK